MKNKNVSYRYFLVGAILICLISIIGSCNKDIIEEGSNWQALAPTKLDSTAGAWKAVVIGANDTFALPAVAATASAAYQNELTEVKAAVGNQTADQKAAIAYWSAGGVLRWNEIMRALVAKYNLPPQDSAGVYPMPDSNNPFNYPQFPFSNPPYAARAYAYVSVAQYDALVAAYKLKTKYGRPAPYKVDASITPTIAKSDLPSYPCEDAVIAASTLVLMKALFPSEVDYLNQQASNERLFKLWAGAATASDIAAGDSLGKLVAAKVLARAKGDGMKNAVGNKAIWDSLANRTFARRDNGKDTVYNDACWRSFDAPSRPPMLPLFGKVKAWNFTDPAAVRLPPPPSTNSADVRGQLDELIGYSQNPTREQLAIVHFWADGAGTQTPPGHWNAIAIDYFQKAHWSEVRTARNFALLNMAMMDAAITCWDNKYTYFHPRPTQLDSRIKTLTGLPNFPGYASGHSTFSGAAESVLGYIIPAEAANFHAQAEEASLSRIYGAIHLRIDCTTGLTSGRNIGSLAIARGKADGSD